MLTATRIPWGGPAGADPVPVAGRTSVVPCVNMPRAASGVAPWPHLEFSILALSFLICALPQNANRNRKSQIRSRVLQRRRALAPLRTGPRAPMLARLAAPPRPDTGDTQSMATENLRRGTGHLGRSGGGEDLRRDRAPHHRGFGGVAEYPLRGQRARGSTRRNIPNRRAFTLRCMHIGAPPCTHSSAYARACANAARAKPTNIGPIDVFESVRTAATTPADGSGPTAIEPAGRRTP